MTPLEGHGGDRIAETLRAHGIETVYTLIGGHIFQVLDGLQKRGMRIVDTRHEQSAAFAAEAAGKLSRAPGVAILDAGPGVMNSVNAVTAARFNGSPLAVISGRAGQSLFGRGSFQEVDHPAVFGPITKQAMTAFEPDQIVGLVADTLAAAGSRPRGPAFLDVSLEAMFTPGPFEVAPPVPASEGALTGDIEEAVRLLAGAERPIVMLGSDVWLDGAEKAARDFVETQRVPVVMNGQGRGVVPSDHALAFNAARGAALAQADVIVIVGTPLDFRLKFGAFGEAKVVHVVDHPSRIGAHANPAAAIAGPLTAALEALASATVRERDEWVATLRAVEDSKRASYEAELRSDQVPIHPVRVYGDLLPLLEPDTIVVIDAGDFGSYAGKYVDVLEPGGWLDPGPYGCLGTACGYALAAGTLYPDRRIVVLLGDGAAGFSMGDWDSLIRHGIDVTLVCGNNAAWGLEKQPMQNLFGYDVVADLRPETRYDEVMRALGGHGEFVRAPDELRPALERALATRGPSLVNVITDPSISYPRGQG